MSAREFINTASVRGILAVTVMALGFYCLLFSNADRDIKVHVSAMMMFVLGYYFGSTHNSSRKDDTISKLTK